VRYFTPLATSLAARLTAEVIDPAAGAGSTHKAKAKLRNQEQAACDLSHAAPNIRSWALALLGSRWPAPPDYGTICEEIALADPDTNMRAAAVRSLSHCYVGTKDTRTAKLLAEILHDGQASNQIRQAAYLSLLCLAHPMGQFDMINDTEIRDRESDWTFVESFLKEKGERRSRTSRSADVEERRRCRDQPCESNR
jgi:hypothetical protein